MKRTAVVALLIVMLTPGMRLDVAAQTPTASQDPPTSAEGVVTELYDLVTFDAGTTPDWDRVRSLFTRPRRSAGALGR